MSVIGSRAFLAFVQGLWTATYHRRGASDGNKRLEKLLSSKAKVVKTLKLCRSLNAFFSIIHVRKNVRFLSVTEGSLC